MSWDVCAVRVPPGVDINNLSDEYEGDRFASMDEVHRAMQELFPDLDFTGAGRQIDLDYPSMEITLGGTDPVSMIVFNCFGSADPTPFILELCRKLDVVAFDSDNKPLVQGESSSWEEWKSFRDDLLHPKTSPQRRWWHRRVRPGSRD